MLEFLQNNWGSFAVGAVVLAVIVLIVMKLVRDILPYGSFRMYPSSLRRWVIFTVLALDTPTSRETSDELITGPFIPRRYIANRYFFCA